MRYENILTAFYGSPWAILPEKLDEIRVLLHSRAQGLEVSEEDVAAIVASRRADGVSIVGRVAVLPVFGVISQRVGMMGRASGGISTEEVGAKLDELVADRQVRSIVMAFDSPGGSVYGVSELASKIRSLRQEKKIVGLADSVAASAAYWLISQTSEVNVTPGGQVGSIGVLAAHTDISKWEEMRGMKTTYVTAGKYKAEMAPESPLSEEARAELQGKVDDYYGMFIADVAKGRNVTEHHVKEHYGQGRMLTAKDARAKGMVDHVSTLAQVLHRLGADSDAGARASASEPELQAKLASYRYRARAVEVAD